MNRKRGAGMVIALLVPAAMALAEEGRVKVSMPAPMVGHMLANMRDHLAAVSEIQAAIAERDFERTAQVAEQRLGVSSLGGHGADHMAPHMPKAMRAIGGEMHRAATRLALAAQELDLDQSLRELAAVTGRCVACHATYRVH